jgi:uroporphyrinogen decarboxylase
MTEMTSRERVGAAISHIEPDRVPLDIGGGRSISIAVEGYEKLKQYLGISGETHKLSEIFRISKLDESITQRLGSDCYPIVTKSPLIWRPPPSEPGTLVDNWGIKWKQTYYAEGCYYWDVIQSPLEKARVEDLESYSWPDTDDPGYTAGLAQEARTLHDRTQYAIVGDSGFQSHWEMGFLLRGYKQILMDLRRNPEFVSRLMSRILEINIAVTGRFLDAVGQYIDVIRTSDDLATQEGLVLSPAMYRTFLKPVHKKFFDSIKSKTDV